jgi:hypothetical protein
LLLERRYPGFARKHELSRGARIACAVVAVAAIAVAGFASAAFVAPAGSPRHQPVCSETCAPSPTTLSASVSGGGVLQPYARAAR